LLLSIYVRRNKRDKAINNKKPLLRLYQSKQIAIGFSNYVCEEARRRNTPLYQLPPF
jgi:hypothetical protein